MVIFVFSAFSLRLNTGPELLYVEKDTASYSYQSTYRIDAQVEREEIKNPPGFGMRISYTKDVGAGFGFAYVTRDYRIKGSVHTNLPPPIPGSYSFSENLPYRHAAVFTGITADFILQRFFFVMFESDISYNWITPVVTREYVEKEVERQIEEIVENGDLTIEIPTPEAEERWGVRISLGFGGRFQAGALGIRCGAGFDMTKLFSPSSIFSGTARFKLIFGVDY